MPLITSAPYVFYIAHPRDGADYVNLAQYSWNRLATLCGHVERMEAIPVLRRRIIPPAKPHQEPIRMAYLTVKCDDCKPARPPGLLFLQLPCA